MVAIQGLAIKYTQNKIRKKINILLNKTTKTNKKTENEIRL